MMTCGCPEGWHEHNRNTRCNAGEAPALSPLRALRGFFGRRVARDDVDDLVQDAALRMHARTTRAVDTDPIASPDSYVFQVARSVLADRYRRETRRETLLHESLEDRHHPVEEISPERVLSGKEQLAYVVACLADLPERARQAFVLHRFEEMTYPEIARHMGISVSAVEKHIMRAMQQLVARLQER